MVQGAGVPTLVPGPAVGTMTGFATDDLTVALFLANEPSLQVWAEVSGSSNGVRGRSRETRRDCTTADFTFTSRHDDVASAMTAEVDSLTPAKRQERSTAQRLAGVAALIETWDWRSGSPAADSVGKSLPRAQPSPVETPDRPVPDGAAVPASGPERHWGRRPIVVVGGVAVAALAIILGLVLPGSSPAPAPPAHHHPPRAPALPKAPTAIVLEYLGAARAMDAAQSTFTAGLAHLSGVPTVPAIEALATPYGAALQQYQFELALIHWPLAEQAASANLIARVKAFGGFVGSIATVQPIGLGAWITEIVGCIRARCRPPPSGCAASSGWAASAAPAGPRRSAPR